MPSPPLRRLVAIAAVVTATACGSASLPADGSPAGSAATGGPIGGPIDGTTVTDTTAVTATTVTAVAAAPQVERIAYGDGAQQFGELWMPVGVESPPVVVLVHGGFWSTPYDLSLMDPLAADLVARGDAVWNIEYRRLGDTGGGWPGTFDDVAAAIDHLDVITLTRAIDLERVVLVGHSAGGQLALWAAGRSTLPAEAPGADPRITPALAIGQGPVVDLAGAADRGLDGGIVVDLLGGSPTRVPDRYAWATPSVVGDVPLLAVVGSDDTVVPGEFSVSPASPAAIEVVSVPGTDHFDLIDPSTTAWAAVTDRLASVFQNG